MTRSYVGWLWLLSGLPIGLALLVMPPAGRLWCFALFVVLETAHSFSPIVLAWTHRGFRQTVIWSRPWKYIGLPGAVFATASVIGIATSAHLIPYVPVRVFDPTSPFSVLVWAYSTANLFHFGMQDFGVWRLWRKRNDTQGKSILDNWVRAVFGRDWATTNRDRVVRRAQAAICLALVIFFVEVMRHITHSLWVMLFVTGLVSVNHWVVDLGLSIRVARWWFFPGVLVLGLLGFAWMVPSSNGQMIRMIPWLICARLGLGFVHFLYSRWVWQFSNPQVRDSIGKDLLTA